MSEKTDQFCSNLQHRLTEIDLRIQEFKQRVDSANVGLKSDISAQLDKARAEFEEKKQTVKGMQDKLKANIEEKKAETKAKIEMWKNQCVIQKIEKRAQRAENEAMEKTLLAVVAVEAAEFAMLEAINARIDADELDNND